MWNFAKILGVFGLSLMLSGTRLSAQSCDIEQWMVDLHTASQVFLKQIETEAAPQRAQDLRSVAREHSAVSMRRALRKSGLEQHEALLSQISSRQKVMLQSFERYGAARTKATGQIKTMGVLLDELNDVIVALDCAQDPTWRPRQSSGIALFIGTQSPAVAWGAFLVVFSGMGVSLTAYSRISQKNRRREKRYPCRLKARVSIYNQTVETLCLDISRNGMKVKSDAKYSPGTPCHVFFESLTAAAKVQWSNAEYCGLNFNNPLKDTELRALLEHG